MNYSFWADEAYISSIADQLLTGKLNFNDAINTQGVIYQKLHMLIVYMSFKLMGVSELSARFPSIISYFLGIITTFFLAKRLSNIHGGLLSAIIYGLSSLELAYATQAKPYQLLQVITLTLLLILHKIAHDKRTAWLIINNLLALALLSTASLLHNIGLILWMIYGVFLVAQIPKMDLIPHIMKTIHSKYLYFFMTLVVIILYFPLKELGNTLFSTFSNNRIFNYNNTYQVAKLFLYKYPFFSLSALLGFVWIFKKNTSISLAITAYVTVLMIFVNFSAYIFNIRYVFSVFGLIFLYFGIFWAKAGEKYYPKKPWLIPLAVVVILYATGYKIVRYPQAYYNPNIDKYGDIQIANYKDFYGKLKEHFPNYKKLYIVNDTFDAESWYMGRYSNAYLMKFTPKPYKHHTADAMIYGSLEDFRKIMRENPRGLLIMEDWQSFLPEDVKEYAKKNLKLEFRVNSLREAPDDPWPLALYSWGFP